MEAKDLEFFREYLTQMIDDIQRQGEATIEDMSENVEYYSDPADRASAESDRTFALRLRDRLAGRGYRGTRVTRGELGGTIYWRVQIGAFNTLEQAEGVRVGLLQESPDCFVIAD